MVGNCTRGPQLRLSDELGEAIGPSMKFWNDWVDPEDMQAMWEHQDVCREWKNAGEVSSEKVHMLRDFDGRPYVSQIEMQAIAEIIVERHFRGKLSRSMVCAVAEIQSRRYPLTFYCNPRTNEPSSGLMRLGKSTVERMTREGYTAYTVDWKSSMLFRPFVGVYFGAAYLKWLSNYEGRMKSEEFVVRAYISSPKEAGNKSLDCYWTRYLKAKQGLPMNRDLPLPVASQPQRPPEVVLRERLSPGTAKSILYETSPGRKWTYWDEKASPDDMLDMWNCPEVKKEWSRSGERPGHVRFSLDEKMRPYLKKTELKAVAQLIVHRHFAENEINPIMLCTIAEITSKRLLFGNLPHTGIMQVPYSTASWLYTNLGYKGYKLRCNEDLSMPFVSMYFGAAYVCWLSTYNGRAQTDKFIVQSYQSGPQINQSLASAPFWLKYIDTLPTYSSTRESPRVSCCVQ